MVYTLIALVCILFLISIIYVVFFAIHKFIFNKYISCLQIYDNVLAEVITISFAKLNALAAKNQLLKEQIDSLNNKKIEMLNNLNCCKKDFLLLSMQLDKSNFLYCYKFVQECLQKIQICALDFKKFKQKFDFVSQYSHIVESTTHFYHDFWHDLDMFYFNNMKDSKLQKIADLFKQTKDSLYILDNYSQEYNIINVINDIHAAQNNINILFQTIKHYHQLLITKKHICQLYDVVNNLMLEHNFMADINQLNQTIIVKNQILFKENIATFNDKIATLDFESALNSLNNAFIAYNNINVFVRTQIKAPELIKKTIIILDEQIRWLLVNKEQITKNLLWIKKYFTCNTVSILAEEIIGYTNQVCQISNKIQTTDFTNDSQTKLIIDNLLSSVKEVISIRNEMAKKLRDLIFFLEKNISFISKLNSLYILQHQLLIYTKQLFTIQKSDEYEKVIKKQLSKIDWYLQPLLDDYDSFNFFKVLDDDLVLIDKTTNNIVSHINYQKTLKNYATEMFIFANRYQNKFSSQLNDAEKLYQQRDFENCLNTLINVCKTAVN